MAQYHHRHHTSCEYMCVFDVRIHSFNTQNLKLYIVSVCKSVFIFLVASSRNGTNPTTKKWSRKIDNFASNRENVYIPALAFIVILILCHRQGEPQQGLMLLLRLLSNDTMLLFVYICIPHCITSPNTLCEGKVWVWSPGSQILEMI